MTARCSKSHRPLWFHQNISNRLINLQPAHPQGMAKGINIGGVAITATVRRRVTEDRVSVSIPSYGFPHSIVDKTSSVKKGQPIEVVGEVTHIDGDWVTVNLGVPVTVNMTSSYLGPTGARRT